MVDVLSATTLDLPLRWQTPAGWADRVLRAPLKLLNDHAHLEKKAAANALELLNRWPEPCPPENWVTVMTAVARDEVEHLAIVTRLLARRGGRLTKRHRNHYASDLRGLVRSGTTPGELVDRLLISALIEARSCERFARLAHACRGSGAEDRAGDSPGVTVRGRAPNRAGDSPALMECGSADSSGAAGDAELAKLYGELYASEAGHYRVFLGLARALPAAAGVEARWDELLDVEARVIVAQPIGPTMHSGVA